MAQWVMALSSKLVDWSSDPQKATKSWAVACNPSAWEAQTGDPQGMLAS